MEALGHVPLFQLPAADDMDHRLSHLRRYSAQQLKWAEVLSDGAIRSLEPGARSGGWRAILPPDQVSNQRHGSIFMSTRVPVNILYIAPCPLSKEWAGIGGTKAVSCLYDVDPSKVGEPEPADEHLRSDLRAYLTEVAIAERVWNGRLRPTLTRMLERVHIHGLSALLGAWKEDDASFLGALDWADSQLSKEPSYSGWERAMRIGFFMVAALLDLASAEEPGSDLEARQIEALAALHSR